MVDQYVPDRGDIVWLQFNPKSGHEQAGKRPALVLSPGQYNGKVGLALLCPLTTKKKGYPFEVDLPQDLPVEGVILADQVKSLDWKARQATFICNAPDEVVQQVLEKVNLLLSP
jgi:mRNA interferase MazF